MARMYHNSWICIVCGGKAVDSVVCYECERKEQDKQRTEPGSLTQKQLSYIEYLMTKLDTQATGQIIYSVVPDYEGDLENLSANQAGGLIARLLAVLEHSQQVSEAK